MARASAEGDRPAARAIVRIAVADARGANVDDDLAGPGDRLGDVVIDER